MKCKCYRCRQFVTKTDRYRRGQKIVHFIPFDYRPVDNGCYTVSPIRIIGESRQEIKPGNISVDYPGMKKQTTYLGCAVLGTNKRNELKAKGHFFTLQKIDALLWTFRADSFVPHKVLGSSPGALEPPVTIGCDSLPSAEYDLLINLADTVPDGEASFPRIAEVVSSDDACRSLSRQRFIDYRGQGHTLDTHKL